MQIKWKKNSKPDVLLRKIEKVTTVNSDGSIDISNLEYDDSIDSLTSKIDLSNYLIIDIYPIIYQTINDMLRNKQSLTPTDFIEKLNINVKTKISVKEKIYHFVTSLSIGENVLPEKIQIESSLIRTYNRFPKKFASRNEFIQEFSPDLAIEHKNYTKVVITIEAHTDHMAAEKALRSIDILRAILSFYLNPYRKHSSEQYIPINIVRLGETHTLHQDNGEVINNIWYEPNFKESPIPDLRGNNIGILRNNIKAFLIRLKNKKSNYGNSIQEALLRYVRAFDERDTNTAFLRLWGALEILTLPSGVTKYDILIKRCAFLFRETEYHIQKLEHLREYRNKSAHVGEYNMIGITNCYRLQAYFKKLIIFHLSNKLKFDSLEEANEFLDLSPNIEDLQKKEKIIKKAIKYRK